MKLDQQLKQIQIALKQADWFSSTQHVDYDIDRSLGVLLVDGKIEFFDGTVLEFTESRTPGRYRYRFQYMQADGQLIFRYDNAPHHPDVATFPDHKHERDTIVESPAVSLREVIEEIISIIVV